MHFEKILVATDLSEASVSAIDFAAYESKMTASAVTVLNVFEDFEPSLELGRQIWNPETLSGLRAEYIEAAKERLEHFAKKSFHEIDVTTEAVAALSQPAHEVIAKYAHDHGCDLIIVAMHRRGPLGTLFLGKTVGRLLNQAPCPVLVVPQPKEEE